MVTEFLPAYDVKRERNKRSKSKNFKKTPFSWFMWEMELFEIILAESVCQNLLKQLQ